MTKPAGTTAPPSYEEKSARMAELVANSKEATPPAPVEEKVDLYESTVDRIIVVKIPSRFTEDKVKTLIGSMESQFEGSGYRVIFAPDEVGVHLIENQPQGGNRWA